MNILLLNAGSSSLKATLMNGADETVLAQCLAEVALRAGDRAVAVRGGERSDSVTQVELTTRDPHIGSEAAQVVADLGGQPGADCGGQYGVPAEPSGGFVTP